jgi:Glyoxalase-like domain
MGHYSRLAKVVVDVPADSHAAELSFWQDALGQKLTQSADDPEYHGVDLPGLEFRFLLQRLDEGAPRVHLDVHTDDLDAEVARLEGLGARRVRLVRGLWIMADPAGLPFCVIGYPAGSLHAGNATHWP